MPGKGMGFLHFGATLHRKFSNMGHMAFIYSRTFAMIELIPIPNMNASMR